MEVGIIVLREGITGLLIGFAANICNSIIVFSGKVIDMEIGLAMANMFDPTTKSPSGLTGTMYNYFIMMLLIVTDMHHFILRALVDTFEIIPINGTVFDWDHLMGTMVMFLTDLMVIGFRIVLPVFCTILLLNAILGVLAKVSPQMNMFAVGIQLKIMVGLATLLVTAGILPGTAEFIFDEMKRVIVSFVGAMQ